MSGVQEILAARLDPSWARVAPSALVADWEPRRAELAAVSPSVAAASTAFCEAMAAAPDAATIAAVRNAALSRESGAFTAALALVPGLPPDEKRIVGRALNLGTVSYTHLTLPTILRV